MRFSWPSVFLSGLANDLATNQLLHCDSGSFIKSLPICSNEEISIDIKPSDFYTREDTAKAIEYLKIVLGVL